MASDSPSSLLLLGWRPRRTERVPTALERYLVRCLRAADRAPTLD